MESRQFIKQAKELTVRIEAIGNADNYSDADAMQKEITQLFAGLQNPSLLAASQLCKTAIAAGFTVDLRLRQRIAEYDLLYQG